MTLAILFLTLYVLPAFIVWKSVNWLYKNVFIDEDPTAGDVLFALLPVVNILAAPIYFLYVQSFKRESLTRKFFGLGDRQ
jgi:hypothetical protein